MSKIQIKKLYLVLLFLFIIIFLGTVVLIFLPNKKLTLADQNFNLIIANSPQEKEKGLGGRDSLDEKQGMLFINKKPESSPFWMKDMKFAIDIIWFDENKKVISIKENATPDSYPGLFYPDQNAQYILELNAGSVGKWGIKIGDQAYF